MLKGRKKKQTGSEVAAKVTGKKDAVYKAKANPNATSSELDAKKIVPAAASAQNISKSQGSGTTSLNESALRIKTTTIEVNTLLKGSLVLDKMQAKNKKETREELKRTKAENQLEADNKKGKFSFPIPGAKKVKSFWERIKTFFLTIFVGMIGMKLMPLLPHLLKALPLIAKVADFIIDVGIWLVDALATALKWGYDAYDWTRNQVEEKLGEGAAEKFDSFMGGLNKVINLTIALGLAAAKMAGVGGPQGPKGKSRTGADLDVDPKTKRKLDADEIYDTKTKQTRKKTSTEIDLQKKNNLTNKQLDEIKLKKSQINPKTGKKWTNADAIAEVKKPKGLAKWLQKGQEIGGKGLRFTQGVLTTAGKQVGKIATGVLNSIPNFNKLGSRLSEQLTTAYKNADTFVKKRYEDVVLVATKLKGKYDSALKGVGSAFNSMKANAKQAILEKVLAPIMEKLEPLIKRVKSIGPKIVKVLEKIPGYKQLQKVLKKFGGVGSKKLMGEIGEKTLPVIGGVLNLAFAYDRLANGDSIGGLIEGLSGILDLSGLFPAMTAIGPPMSMVLDAYMFGRDFVPQIQKGEEKAINGLGLGGFKSDIDKMFAALPDLGTITKFITGGGKEEDLKEEGDKGGDKGAAGGESKGAPLGETDEGSATAESISKEDGAGESGGSNAKPSSSQETKLQQANQQGGAQAVIDSISTTASYEETGKEIVVVEDDSSSTMQLNREESSGETLVGMNQKIGESSQPYETLYKGS